MSKIIDINAEGLLKVVKELEKFPSEIRPAMARAVNRTIDSTNTKVKREVAAEYAVKQKEIAKEIKKERANVNKLTGALVAEGSPTPLYRFSHTPQLPNVRTRYGVKVKVKKSGGKKKILHHGNKAFILAIKRKDDSAANMIFARRRNTRYPIDKLFTLSVPQMISDLDGEKGTIQRIKAHANQTLEKTIDQEINYRLDKMAKKAEKEKAK